MINCAINAIKVIDHVYKNKNECVFCGGVEGGTPIKDEGTQTTTTLAPPSKEVRDTTTINVYQGLPADITTATGTSVGG